jgi:hypothetical protein
MKILEEKGQGGKTAYHVQFEERRLEDIVARLNRVERRDEEPFEAAAALSEFNQRAYELFARPLVQATANPLTAQLGRQFHKLRFERWSISDANPFLWWLKPAADAVRAARAEVPADQGLRRAEKLSAAIVTASLDLYRDLRDANSEAQFFQVYGNLLHLAEGARAPKEAPVTDRRELAVVKQALAAIDQGGYPEAIARCACLLKAKGRPLPLEDLATKAELLADYRDLLPALERDAARRVRGLQEIIVDLEPERALATLPRLLRDPADRERLAEVLGRLLADRRVPWGRATPEQHAMLGRIREAIGGRLRLAAAAAPKARKAVARKAVAEAVARKPAKKRKSTRAKRA